MGMEKGEVSDEICLAATVRGWSWGKFYEDMAIGTDFGLSE